MWIVPAAFALLAVHAPDVLRYDVTLRPDLSASTLSGTVDLEVIVDGTELILDADNASLQIKRVELAGKALAFQHLGDQLRIGLPPRSSKVWLAISYEARPSKGLLAGADWMVARYRTRAWMPCRDLPADPALISVSIEAAPGLQIRGPGERDAERTNRFVVSFPLPPYLYGFAVGKFREVGAPFIAKDALAFMEKRTGARYPFAEYTQVLIPGGDAQEAAGFAVLGDDTVNAVKDPRDAWFVIHEVAHQWFGVALPLADWADNWITEGFANFLTAIYAGEKYGAAEREVELARAEQRLRRMKRKNVVRPLAFKKSIDDTRAGGPVPYTRGQLVLAALEEQLGAPVFWRAIERLFAERTRRPLSTESLKMALEKSSGKKLGPFFEQWVYAERPPELRAEHTWSPGQVLVTVTSTAAIKEPIPLSIHLRAGERRSVRTVRYTGGKQVFRLEAPRMPEVVHLEAGSLPVIIEHARPIEMLEAQIKSRGSLRERLNALDQWSLVCVRSDSCPTRQALIEELRASPERVLAAFAAAL